MLKSGRKPKSEYKEIWDTISSGKNWYGEFENIKQRASSLGGTFDIYRENDCETVVMLTIPLKYHEEDENSDL
jgi:hypothetical protein